MDDTLSCIAFAGDQRIARGSLAEVACAVKTACDAHPQARVLIFDARTSAPIEVDTRASTEQMLARLAATYPDAAATTGAEAPPRNGPGRPRLGVVAREVTLLPRHWEWLASQPGGASVALRKLVDQARRAGQSADRVRAAQEATLRFMSAMAGDRRGYEEATRALFAGDGERFAALIAGWPADLVEHLRELAAAAFVASDTAPTGQEPNHA